MADGYRPEVAGVTTSGKFCVSVVVNLSFKFGDPRISSCSFLTKNIFFQHGVCCRKEVADDVIFCWNMSEGM